MPQQSSSNPDDIIIPLCTEDVSVDRRKVERDTVRVVVKTKTREEVVDENLTHSHVEVEHVPIGRPIDEPPPVRRQGDVITIPVIEEKIVIKRQLFLKEELVVKTVKQTERYHDSVVLRDQEATIERTHSKENPVNESEDKEEKEESVNG